MHRSNDGPCPKPTSASDPKRTLQGSGQVKKLAPIVALSAALLGCSHMPLPAGYRSRVMNDSIHHPPGKFYLAIEQEGTVEAATPPSESELAGWWQAAAQDKCGSKRVVVTYGPELAQVLPEYCVGNSDCTPSVHGYFFCSR